MHQAMLTNALGYVAAGLVFATFCAQQMALLRALAIAKQRGLHRLRLSRWLMADPDSAQRHVANQHPALSAIVAGTLRHDDG